MGRFVRQNVLMQRAQGRVVLSLLHAWARQEGLIDEGGAWVGDESSTTEMDSDRPRCEEADPTSIDWFTDKPKNLGLESLQLIWTAVEEIREAGMEQFGRSDIETHLRGTKTRDRRTIQKALNFFVERGKLLTDLKTRNKDQDPTPASYSFPS